MSKDDANSQFLKEYMQELNLSKDEYLKPAAAAYQSTMRRGDFYSEFLKKNAGSSADSQDLYEEYVSGLTEQAVIEYKN